MPKRPVADEKTLQKVAQTWVRELDRSWFITGMFLRPRGGGGGEIDGLRIRLLTTGGRGIRVRKTRPHPLDVLASFDAGLLRVVLSKSVGADHEAWDFGGPLRAFVQDVLEQSGDVLERLAEKAPHADDRRRATELLVDLRLAAMGL